MRLVHEQVRRERARARTHHLEQDDAGEHRRDHEGGERLEQDEHLPRRAARVDRPEADRGERVDREPEHIAEREPLDGVVVVARRAERVVEQREDDAEPHVEHEREQERRERRQLQDGGDRQLLPHAHAGDGVLQRRGVRHRRRRRLAAAREHPARETRARLVGHRLRLVCRDFVMRVTPRSPPAQPRGLLPSAERPSPERASLKELGPLKEAA